MVTIEKYSIGIQGVVFINIVSDPFVTQGLKELVTATPGSFIKFEKYINLKNFQKIASKLI